MRELDLARTFAFIYFSTGVFIRTCSRDKLINDCCIWSFTERTVGEELIKLLIVGSLIPKMILFTHI
jgi:hypothetical protein